MKNGGYQIVTLDLAQDLTIITENINISKILSGQWLFKDYSKGTNIINMYYLLYGKYAPNEDEENYSLQQKVIQLKNIRCNTISYLNTFTQFYMSNENPLVVEDTSTTSKTTTINNPLIGYFILGNQALLIAYNISRGILVNIFKGGDSNA